MMLLERWAVAAALGMSLVSTAGAPGQSPASPDSQNTQQNQDQNKDKTQDKTQDKNSDKNTPDMDDAEPAEYHPPAQIEQPATPSPPVESHPEPNPPKSAPQPPVETRPAAPASPPAPAVAAKQPAPPPDPPLSTDPVERQLQIDTAHLLQLTEELKAELDKAGNDTLSLAALRKADEVQKLAKELKERMKDREQVIQSKP
jgi:cytoskeletal protein RodZ